MKAQRRAPGALLLRLYPAWWRDRYGAEMAATLEEAGLGGRARIDLARGALDARLHGPGRLTAGAALLAGGLWTYAGTGIVAQPAPPDWPGYQLDSLPLLIVAVAAGTLATIGCWARASDAAARAGAATAALAGAGNLIWLAAVVAALAGIAYGWPTVLAQAVGVAGTLLVGIVLLRSGDVAIGGLLALGPALMLFAWPAAWLGHGLAWTLVGSLLLRDAAASDRFAPRSA